MGELVRFPRQTNDLGRSAGSPGIMHAGTRETFARHLAAKGQSPNTIRRRLLTLDRVSRIGEPLELGRLDLQDWVDSLDVQPQSRRKYIEDLASFYRWAVTRDLIVGDPTVGIERARAPKYQPRPIPTEELKLARRLATPRTRLVLTLAAYAGLRAMEVAGLHSNDVDWERGLLTIRGKGQVERNVPMHPLVAADLEGVDGWVAGWCGCQVQPRSISMLVSTFLRANGMDRTCHQLRHWFATTAYRNTHDILATQQLLGHASVATTQVYAKADSNATRQAVMALPAA